jgi:hypothetical protein
MTVQHKKRVQPSICGDTKTRIFGSGAVNTADRLMGAHKKNQPQIRKESDQENNIPVQDVKSASNPITGEGHVTARSRTTATLNARNLSSNIF